MYIDLSFVWARQTYNNLHISNLQCLVMLFTQMSHQNFILQSLLKYRRRENIHMYKLAKHALLPRATGQHLRFKIWTATVKKLPTAAEVAGSKRVGKGISGFLGFKGGAPRSSRFLTLFRSFIGFTESI